jgi:hypothetical protein
VVIDTLNMNRAQGLINKPCLTRQHHHWCHDQ